MGLLVAQALLIGMQHDVVFANAAWYVLLSLQERSLRYVVNLADSPSLSQGVAQGDGVLLAHAVEQEVGTAETQYWLEEFVLPIVVVGEPSQRGFDAAQHHGHVGEELFQYFRVDYAWVVGAHVVTRVRAVGVVVSHASVGGIAVHHAVHVARRYGEEEAWPPQLLEIAEIAMPVWLRHYRYLISSRLYDTPHGGSAEGRVIHVGVAREKDDIKLCPPAQLTFLLRCRQEVGELWVWFLIAWHGLQQLFSPGSSLSFAWLSFFQLM